MMKVIHGKLNPGLPWKEHIQKEEEFSSANWT
jgi:hypothetical protein